MVQIRCFHVFPLMGRARLAFVETNCVSLYPKNSTCLVVLFWVSLYQPENSKFLVSVGFPPKASHPRLIRLLLARLGVCDGSCLAAGAGPEGLSLELFAPRPISARSPPGDSNRMPKAEPVYQETGCWWGCDFNMNMLQNTVFYRVFWLY